jgi:hypothetical protein
MSNWSGWDWISYGCLGLAAFGLAFGSWVKESPEMFSGIAFISSPRWAFVPAALFAIATVVFLVRMLTQEPQKAVEQPAQNPSVVQDLKPLEKRFTAYDVEQRLRAIDDLYSLLSGNVMTASADGERLNKALMDKVLQKTAAADLTTYSNTVEQALNSYFTTAGKYMIFPDIHHDAIALVWNPFDVVSSARNLSYEIKSLEQQNANVPLYLKSNKFMADFSTGTSGRFWTWINEKQQLLAKRRREYEAAPVYPK